MTILLLNGYNNYFNRIVKKETNITAYKSASTSYLEYASVNFDPQDGILTSLVVGSEEQKRYIPPVAPATEGTEEVLKFDDLGAPDYLVCYDSSTIKSRWFVLESVKIREGQYKLALKRDVLADFNDEIMVSPCFIEKGAVGSSEDPVLFNNESMTYNQIKDGETLLKDSSGCAWVIGYVSQDKTRYPALDDPDEQEYYENNSPITVLENYSDLPQVVKDVIEANSNHAIISCRLYSQLDGTNYRAVVYQRFRQNSSRNCLMTFDTNNIRGSSLISDSNWNSTYPNNKSYLAQTGSKSIDWSWRDRQDDYPIYWTTGHFSNFVAGSSAIYQAYSTANLWGNYYSFYQLSNVTKIQLENINGIFVNKDNKIYKLEVVHTENPTQMQYTITNGSAAGTAYANAWNSFKSIYGTEPFFPGSNNTLLINEVSLTADNPMATISFDTEMYRISMTEVSSTLGTTIKSYIPANRAQCYDTPMDIFAIPYTDVMSIADTGPLTYHCSKQIALQAAMALGQAGNNLYDIQILPYCPIDEIRTMVTRSGDNLALSLVDLKALGYTEEVNFNYIKNANDSNIGVIFWARQSTFSIDLNYTLDIADKTPLNLKISNECDLYRLVSPNYSGQFEFSLAKSGGSIIGFNADCNYKPYSPYIHVSPNLKGLYGEDFAEIDDARGLICGGDFSAARWTSAWEQYQLNNKNYQNIFDRQIQNMDINNAIAREQQSWQYGMGIVGGTIGGAASGAMTGAKVGGGWGALIGGVVGAGTGLIGNAVTGMKDREWLVKQQEEARDYAIDMYGYQLGNIQALPYSLSRTSALTYNNRLFPFVEHFTCTGAEKNALTNKLKYNGMTIMRIGNLEDYQNTEFDRVFLKGQLINIDIGDDSHIANEIYNEVNKGFYVLK